MTTAFDDRDLLPWLLGIANGKPHPSGDFLRSLADAALRADATNYPILRPALVAIREKYPEYCDPEVPA